MNISFTDYEISSGVYVDNTGKYLTNGVFNVTKHQKITDEEKVSHVIEVEFEIIFNEMKNTEIVKIPLHVLKSNNLLKYIPEDFCFYSVTKKFEGNFIRNKILEDLQNLAIDEIYILKQGHNIATDRHIFCLGNCIINSLDNLGLTYITTSDKLLKPHNSKESCMEWINRFCSLDKDTMPVLLLSVISSIIIPLLKEAGTDSMFVAYIYGETGTGKSTYSKLLTEIYSNTKNYLTLSSDITGIREMMVQVKDFVMLADDLNISGVSRVKASKEAKISEIIQQAANGDLVKYKGEETYFEGILFVTAEYVLKNASTNNRCVLLNIKEQMDTDKVDYLKENHGLYIEFLKEFTRYVYNNFEQNVKHIKDLSAVVSVKESNCRSVYAGIMRIEMTEKTLMTALGLLLDFFKIKLVLPDDAINKYNNIFVSSVRNCIDNTKEHVKKENKDSRIEYIDEIARMIEYSLDGFYEDCNYIAKDYKKYKKAKAKA